MENRKKIKYIKPGLTRSTDQKPVWNDQKYFGIFEFELNIPIKINMCNQYDQI